MLLSCFPELYFNVDSGYLEGLVRGFKAGVLSQADYVNLVQCESLEGGWRVGGPPAISGPAAPPHDAETGAQPPPRLRRRAAPADAPPGLLPPAFGEPRRPRPRAALAQLRGDAGWVSRDAAPSAGAGKGGSRGLPSSGPARPGLAVRWPEEKWALW